MAQRREQASALLFADSNTEPRSPPLGPQSRARKSQIRKTGMGSNLKATQPGCLLYQGLSRGCERCRIGSLALRLWSKHMCEASCLENVLVGNFSDSRRSTSIETTSNLAVEAKTPDACHMHIPSPCQCRTSNIDHKCKCVIDECLRQYRHP